MKCYRQGLLLNPPSLMELALALKGDVSVPAALLLPTLLGAAFGLTRQLVSAHFLQSLSPLHGEEFMMHVAVPLQRQNVLPVGQLREVKAQAFLENAATTGTVRIMARSIVRRPIGRSVTGCAPSA